jgi:hypothetical protein
MLCKRHAILALRRRSMVFSVFLAPGRYRLECTTSARDRQPTGTNSLTSASEIEQYLYGRRLLLTIEDSSPINKSPSEPNDGGLALLLFDNVDFSYVAERVPIIL